ncbi:MAG TPA: hypothetical protein VJC01_02740 [Candidatus Paceibacterota bacterium]
MKINTNSWHYRIQKVFNRDNANTLCSYFWKVVGSMIGLSVIYTILSVTTLISYFISPFFGYYPKRFSCLIFPSVDFFDKEFGVRGLTSRKPLFQFKSASFYGYQLLLGGFIAYSISILGGWLWTIIIIMGIVAAIFLAWFLYVIFNKTRRTDSWIIVKEYLKAVKNKTCPLIEYID